MKDSNDREDLAKSYRDNQDSSKWKNFKEKSMNNIIKVGSTLGNNRYLVAIRDAFMLPFTLTTGAAIPLILADMFFQQNSVLTGLFPSITNSQGIIWLDLLVGQPLSNVFWAVMAGFSIYLCVGLGYFLGRSYGKDGIISAALCVAVFFSLKPLDGLSGTIISQTLDGQTVDGAAGSQQSFDSNYLGNSGMAIALIASMIATYMYVKLMDVRWLVPKLPDSVPPMVAKAFASIFVGSIVLGAFAFADQLWYVLATKVDITGQVTSSSADDTNTHITITVAKKVLSTPFAALEFVIAKPLMGLSSNIGATVVITFLVAFFWFFGIHGTNIMTPITAIVWDANVLRNAAYWVVWKKLNANGVAPNGSYWTYPIEVSGVTQNGLLCIPMAGLGYVGGTGSTLGFLVGLLIFSKSKVHRDIAKLSVVPGLFGINEPVNFGIPIVLTPIYFIPYVFGFSFIYTLGHIWILIHWIRPGVVWTPTMPYGINIIFATDFDWWSLLVAIIQLGVSFLVWLPFVFIGPKYQEKVEQLRIEKENLKKEQENEELANK